MLEAEPLRPDCPRCAALCCMALAFDRSDSFAIDKPAGESCPHLGAAGHCRIHAGRVERGFSGCVAYDCHGAGQRVTQELFAGRSWQDDPALVVPMVRAFGVMQRIHLQLALLREAGKLPLSPADRAKLAGLEAALDPPGGWTAETLGSARLGEIGRDCRAFLRSLKAVVGAH